MQPLPIMSSYLCLSLLATRDYQLWTHRSPLMARSQRGNKENCRAVNVECRSDKEAARVCRWEQRSVSLLEDFLHLFLSVPQHSFPGVSHPSRPETHYSKSDQRSSQPGLARRVSVTLQRLTSWHSFYWTWLFSTVVARSLTEKPSPSGPRGRVLSKCDTTQTL